MKLLVLLALLALSTMPVSAQEESSLTTVNYVKVVPSWFYEAWKYFTDQLKKGVERVSPS